MNPLLLSGFANSIYVEKSKLIIYNKLKKEKLEFYPHQIPHDSIIIDGHTGNITFDALRWLMKHDINVTILNWNGNMLGVILPKEPKNGKLKIMQYQAYLNSSKRLTIASQLVSHKIAHTYNLLNELARYYDGITIAEVQKVFVRERSNFEDSSQSINNLLNYEGRIAAYYWSILAIIFKELQADFHFVKRGNRSYSWNTNASDEVNALLNYGYGILESEIRKDNNSIGLDSTIGFLHELAQAKTPLVYDIQELFRWLVDLSVLQILEEKKLKKSDFIVTENYNLRLKPQTAKMLIEKISLNFNRTSSYKAKNHTYENILFDNVQQLANFIVGKRRDLHFNIPEFRIPRVDSLELQKGIAAMSHSERKRLDINKSTLWYQKRQLKAGKKLKLYTKSISKLTDISTS